MKPQAKAVAEIQAHHAKAAGTQTEVCSCAGDVSQCITSWQHILPELLVDVVEYVCIGVYVVEGLGGQAQGALIIPHGLKDLSSSSSRDRQMVSAVVSAVI